MAQAMESVRYEEEFILKPSGLKLFTCRWLPRNQDPKALIFLCHGYAVECSITMRGTGVRLAEVGYAVHGIDYEGHGKSSGLQAYIPNFDELVNVCLDNFTSICEKEENRNKLKYLYGESMGGAVALLLHWKKPNYWNGAIFVAPMCKIVDALKPHPILISGMKKLCSVIPTWKLVPTKNILEHTIKDPIKREEMRCNPYCYNGKPRLKTAFELLLTTMDIENKLHEVKLPFIILHGGDDQITDPKTSELLYNNATSSDKTFKLYPGMWHALTSGEAPEDIDLVFSDVISWLNRRSDTGSSRL